MNGEIVSLRKDYEEFKGFTTVSLYKGNQFLGELSSIVRGFLPSRKGIRDPVLDCSQVPPVIRTRCLWHRTLFICNVGVELNSITQDGDINQLMGKGTQEDGR